MCASIVQQPPSPSTAGAAGGGGSVGSGPDRRPPLLTAAVVAAPLALAAAVGTAYAVESLRDESAAEVELRLSEGDAEPAGPDVTGRVLPHRRFERFAGGSASLADYAGRPVVLNFFASYCAPCQREMPALQRVAEDLGAEVAVVGMNLADEPDAAAALVERTGVTYDLGRDPDAALAEDLGVVNLPTTVFATADHEVVEVHTGALSESELRSRARGLLEGA
jgi:thiol-disulfide isomerase/thioredoxin